MSAHRVRAAARPTIRDVSRLAGVSRMTVSRAISDPGLVLPATRARIEKAITDLGYVPDRAAGGLASRRTGFVALLLPTLTNANFAAAAHGLTEALEPGHDLLIAYTDYRVAEEERQLRSLLARRPEAIVLTGAAHGLAISRLLLAAGIPVVEIADLPGRPFEHVVGFSNDQVGRNAARHLIGQGFRRIAAIGASAGGDAIDHRGEERLRGFEDELRTAGRDAGLVLRQGTPPVGYDHGAAAIGALLDRGAAPDAVFAVSDLSAVGAVMEAQRRGLNVPADLAVMGFGDFDIGRIINPPLTTVHVDFHDLGRRTGALILDLLAQTSPGAPRRLDVGLTVLERGSTARRP